MKTEFLRVNYELIITILMDVTHVICLSDGCRFPSKLTIRSSDAQFILWLSWRNATKTSLHNKRWDLVLFVTLQKTHLHVIISMIAHLLNVPILEHKHTFFQIKFISNIQNKS